jgi:hypothetical protein
MPREGVKSLVVVVVGVDRPIAKFRFHPRPASRLECRRHNALRINIEWDSRSCQIEAHSRERGLRSSS